MQRKSANGFTFGAFTCSGFGFLGKKVYTFLKDKENDK
jgi:hypothetical protein